MMPRCLRRKTCTLEIVEKLRKDAPKQDNQRALKR
jgi:hypothetical protein